MINSGRCLCGAVKVHAIEMNTHLGVCHCEMCRKRGGGPLMTADCGTAVTFKCKQNVSRYASSEWAEGGFCCQSGSHLFYRLMHGGTYFIPTGLFKHIPELVFDCQVFIDKKPSYYDFSNMMINMAEEEVFAKYAPPKSLSHF